MSPRPARTVFLGSGSFALPILEAVAGHPALELLAVISAPDRPAGRGRRLRTVPVVELARERGWPVRQPLRLREPDEQAAVRALRPELLVLADYGQIVPAGLVEAPRHGALNVHPSLLPRHRGASPVAATILAGDRESGVTVIRMDAGIDSGPIVVREPLGVAEDETAPRLEARLAMLGARLLSAVLGSWLEGKISPVPQPTSGATLTRPLRRADGRLDWRRPAADLERQVRAYQPWPGSSTSSPIGRLTIWRGSVVAEWRAIVGAVAGSDAPPGTVVPLGGGIAVACGAGALEIVDVQRAGGTRVSGRDLRNGYPGIVGARLS